MRVWGGKKPKRGKKVKHEKGGIHQQIQAEEWGGKARFCPIVISRKKEGKRSRLKKVVE